MSEEILGRGRFRVDRKRALEKMERFQLADPLAYTLELLAAAVSAGAERIEVENDSDDFVIRWVGDGPTRVELDGIFDHLFGGAAEPRHAMLQHLALGVLGALGQSPKWVHVDREGPPSLRLSVRDPAETLSVEHAHPHRGTRIHVRQRLSMANLAEALLLPVQAAAETRLLRQRGRWCPVPLLIDGKPVARPEPGGARASIVQAGFGLWLSDTPRGAVEVVRHGVVVGSVERRVGDVWVSGWLAGDALQLDASRANIVRDGAWAAAERELDEGMAQLLTAWGGSGEVRLLVAGEDAALLRGALRDAAEWLAARQRPLGPFGALPLLVDLRGRAWSPLDLLAFDGLKGTSSDGAGMAEEADVVFSANLRGPLDALCPGLPDLTERLRARVEGRMRRRRAEQRRLAPEFPAVAHQRRFVDGPLRGAVQFRDGDDTLLTHVRIGGLAVEELRLPSPAGPMEAILDHPFFAPDDTFQHVAEDAAFFAARSRLLLEARLYAAEHIDRLARGARLAPDAAWVYTAAVRAAGAKARADLDALLAANPADVLLRAPAFATGDGRRLALPELLQADDWIVAVALPPACPALLARRVLLLPDPLVGAWVGWLRGRARDGRGVLDAEVRGAVRRAQPRRTPVIDRPVVARVAVGGALRGELGFVGFGADTRLELLRDGVPICTVPAAFALPGVVGVINSPGFAVDAAHEALSDPAALPALVRHLEPTVDALALALWGNAEALPLSDALLAWIAARGAKLPEAARERVFARALDGAAITWQVLQDRQKQRNRPRLKVLSTAPRDVPGFEDAIVAGPALHATLEAVGGRGVRSADADLAGARRNLDAYLGRPAAVDPAALAASVEEKDGVRARWFLPLDPERAGVLRVEARWKGRVLTGFERGEHLGLHGVIEGPSITPSAALTSLSEPARLHPWSRHARSRFDDLVRDALDARIQPGALTPTLPAHERRAWCAILARLEGCADRSKAETALRDRLAELPLYARLDGAVYSRADITTAAAVEPVYHVPPGTPSGPTDTPWYLLSDPYTLRSLGYAAASIRPGAEALAAWREGEARRRSLVPRPATIPGACLVKAPLHAAGVVGEVGLVLSAEQDGIVVQPLVDGLPLEPVYLPFSGAAVAVVSGAAVVPEPDFRGWSEGPARAAACVAIEAAVRALVPRLVGVPEADAWLALHTLADGEGPGADLPAFPLLGGGWASARELGARARLGGIGVVMPGTPGPFVAGAQPVVAPPWMRELLAARFVLADLAPIVERHASRTAGGAGPSGAPAALSAGVVEVVAAEDACLGWKPGVNVVDVVRDGVVLATLEPDGVIPVVGWIRSDAVDVDPCWRGLLPGAARDAVYARIRVLARAVLERLVARAEAPAPRRPGLPAAATTALPSTLRDVLLAALSPMVRSAEDERELRARAAVEPVLGRLVALPLFSDSTGRTGSLDAVLAAPKVRVVDPGTVGTPLPSRGRVWAFGPDERRIVALLRPLVDATETLIAETRGVARRASQLGPPPAVPEGARRVEAGAAAGFVWLGAAGAGLAVRVDGALVERLVTPVPGLWGYVEGPFAVNDAFSSATLGVEVRTAVRAAARQLLEDEGRRDRARLHERFAAALAARSHDFDGLLADPLSPWPDVEVFTDTAGAAVDLRAIQKLIKRSKRLLVGPEGSAGVRRGEPVLLGGAGTLAKLRAWFPGVPAQHVVEVEADLDATRQQAEERKAANVRGKRERLVTEQAGRAWERWTRTPAPKALAGVVDDWASGRRPGWPDLATVSLPGPWPGLVALAAAELTPGLPADPHVAIVSGLAQLLAERERST